MQLCISARQATLTGSLRKGVQTSLAIPSLSLRGKTSGFLPNYACQSAPWHTEEKRSRLFGSTPLRSVGPRTSAVMAGSAISPKVLVPVGTGTEEMEAVIIIDVLRRAGAEVVVASVEDSLQVTCSRGVKLTADVSIVDAAKDKFDLIALPGGMPGAERLRDCIHLDDLVKAQKQGNRLLAAICATPAVYLEANGYLQGQKATCHPGFSSKLTDQSAVESRVVVDGKLTTSRGPGTAFEFALSLVNQLYGREKMEEVAKPMVMYPYSV